MKSNVLHPQYHISNKHRSFGNVKHTGVSNNVHGGAAKWILPHFINMPTGYALKTRLSVPAGKEPPPELRLTYYPEVFKYIFNTY